MFSCKFLAAPGALASSPQVVRDISPQSAAQIVWQYGKLNIPSETLVRGLGAHVTDMDNLAKLGPADAAFLAYGMARVGLPHPPLLAELAKRITKGSVAWLPLLSQLTLPQMLTIVWVSLRLCPSAWPPVPSPSASPSTPICHPHHSLPPCSPIARALDRPVPCHSVSKGGGKRNNPAAAHGHRRLEGILRHVSPV